MTAQLDIFDPRRLARRHDPGTSHQAAEYVAPKLGKLHAEVLALVEMCPRSTANELNDVARFRDSRRIGRRLPELEERGYVRRCAVRACTVTLRPAATWEAVWGSSPPQSL